MWVIVKVDHGQPDSTVIKFKGEDFYYYVDKIIKEEIEIIKEYKDVKYEINKKTINNKHLLWIIYTDIGDIISIDVKYVE